MVARVHYTLTHSMMILMMTYQELSQELAVLVEILSEFQQQNDNIRVRVPQLPVVLSMAVSV